jgi:hypothetical protein
MSDPIVSTLPDPVNDIATEAVRRLDIAAFISKNLDTLYEKLEEAERSVAPDDDIRFVALGEQVARLVINFASGRMNAFDAIAWVREAWKGKARDPDPMTILSMLSLMYIVEEGIKQQHDPARHEAWSRFRRRLAAVSKADDLVAAS